jgi:uncharacterized protein (TIGR02117 family)
MRRRPRGWLALAALLALLLLATLATARPGDPALYPPGPGAGVTVYLIDNGFHSDLALPREAVLAAGGPLAAATAETTHAPWVLVGWGDAKFYEADSPWQGRIPDGLRALLGGRPTVVHLEGVGPPERTWTTGVRRLAISRAGLAAIIRRVDRSLVLAAGAPAMDPAAPRPADEAFFESREGFSLFHLCNHFTSDLLDAAGLPTTPVLDTTVEGMALDLKLRARL